MSFSETISPLLGRFALVWFYSSAAMTIVHDWNRVQALMEARHVPLAPVIMMLALVFIFLGCISLLLGYHARHGAVMLFGLTIVAAVTLHPFWLMGAGRQAEFEIFARDVAICGGLLLMVGIAMADTAVQGLTAITARNGGIFNQLENALGQQDTMKVLYGGFIEKVQTTNLADAATQLSLNQTALQAALQVTSTLNQLSLLNYLPTR
jgi:uncharacterized membrane protein YphA (DoxX/SURF4 family)